MTIEDRLKNMERELGRVKRRNRWLLGAILLVAGGLIAPGVFETTASRARAQGAGTAEQIRARSFILEDEKGKVRGALTVGEFGPYLELLDENGKLRARLAVNKDGPDLSLSDENGKSRAGLAVYKEGSRLALWDETGTTRAALFVDKDVLGLSLADENGKSRAGLAVFEAGPTLSLSDEKGTARFIAGKTAIKKPDGKLIEYSESSLILRGPDGKVIWSAVR